MFKRNCIVCKQPDCVTEHTIDEIRAVMTDQSGLGEALKILIAQAKENEKCQN